MNFLAPFFLVGAAAIAGPVIFHLIRRTTRQRTAFSSLMFLQPSPPRITKRSTLEHWLLLLLRCIALALLALGFSRPFLKDTAIIDPPASAPKRIAILVDTSASLRRAGLWDAARHAAETALQRASEQDQVQLFTFDREVRVIFSFAEWNAAAPSERVALATARLTTVSPGFGGTDLAHALIAASEALAEADGKQTISPRHLVVVSDLQEGSRLTALQAYEWPKKLTVELAPIAGKPTTNAGLQWLAESADTDRAADPTTRFRVVNAPDSTREQFKVGWADATGAFIGAPSDLYVPPGQTRVVALPAPTRAADRVVLTGDDDAFDNTVYAIPPAPVKLDALYFGTEKPDDTRQPFYFLRRALPDSRRFSVKLTAHAPDAPLLASETAPVFFVTDSVSASTAASLRAAVLAGKTVVCAPRSTAAMASLAPLFGVESLNAAEIAPANYAMLGEIDFRHPLFAPFADPRFSDFTKIHVWRYRKIAADVTPGARLIAKFDNGDPALLDIPLGRGRVILFTTGWAPEDSQFALSSKFVPLLYALLELSGNVAEHPMQFFVGDPLPLPAEGGTVTLPDGSTRPVAAGATFTDTTTPGLYRTAQGRYAFNLDPAESRTAPLPRDELEKLGVPLAVPAAEAAHDTAHRAILQGTEAEGRQKLWRWFVAATVLILLVESALAGWTARRPAQPAPAS